MIFFIMIMVLWDKTDEKHKKTDLNIKTVVKSTDINIKFYWIMDKILMAGFLLNFVIFVYEIMITLSIPAL